MILCQDDPGEEDPRYLDGCGPHAPESSRGEAGGEGEASNGRHPEVFTSEILGRVKTGL